MSEQEPPEGFTETCLKGEDWWMQFDAIVNEDILFDGAVTQFPIEPGAGYAVSDHVQLFPPEFSLDIMVTNLPTRQPLTHHDGITEEGVDIDVVLSRPKAPEGLGPITELSGLVITAASNLTRGIIESREERVIQMDVKTYPDLQRVQNVFQALLEIRDESRLFTVSLGGLRDFDECVLRSIRIRREPGNSQALRATLDIRSVLLSETLGSVDVEPKKPREPQNQGKKAGGRKQGKDASEQDEQQVKSILARWAGG